MIKGSARRQQGVVLLAMLAVFIMVITGALIASVSLNQQRWQKQQANLAVLSRGKEALLGYALRQTPPGLLPCPDRDGDGVADLTGNNCRVQLGFLPYNTLGIGESRDGSGALLWYAPELTYTNLALTPALNSSTPSSMRFNLNQVVAAVVIAPGMPTGNQVRNNNGAANYLEGVNGDGNTLTYASAKSAANNDELLALDAGVFWSTIELQVLQEAKASLLSYADSPNCGQLPWAAPRNAPYNSSVNLANGTLPLGVATASGGAPGCSTALAVPPWLQSHWGGQLLYAFCGPSGGSCLTITGDRGATAAALLIAPGIALSSQTRPSAAQNQYFEGDNNDADQFFEAFYSRNHNGNFNDSVQTLSP